MKLIKVWNLSINAKIINKKIKSCFVGFLSCVTVLRWLINIQFSQYKFIQRTFHRHVWRERRLRWRFFHFKFRKLSKWDLYCHLNVLSMTTIATSNCEFVQSSILINDLGWYVFSIPFNEIFQKFVSSITFQKSRAIMYIGLNY